ncbi:MAG: hypothetical protein QM763_15950 [Agriterribacter sp.]
MTLNRRADCLEQCFLVSKTKTLLERVFVSVFFLCRFFVLNAQTTQENILNKTSKIDSIVAVISTNAYRINNNFMSNLNFEGNFEAIAFEDSESKLIRKIVCFFTSDSTLNRSYFFESGILLRIDFKEKKYYLIDNIFFCDGLVDESKKLKEIFKTGIELYKSITVLKE